VGGPDPITGAPGAVSACFAASANSLHEAKRSSGRLAIALASTTSSAGGSSGRAAFSDGGGDCRWPWITPAGLVEVNGPLPVSSQYSEQASEYWSERWSRSAPVSCSGDA